MFSLGCEHRQTPICFRTHVSDRQKVSAAALLMSSDVSLRAWIYGRACFYLELPAFTQQQSSVPLLLGHQIIHQPHFCQADEVCEPIKLCDLSDSVGAEVKKL